MNIIPTGLSGDAPQPENELFLLLGTNLGNREKNIDEAGKLIVENIGGIAKASAIYETAAWGIEEQPVFLNRALIVMTKLSPVQVLEKIKIIEHQLGRIREIKWGSRLMDIDILFYNNEIITLPDLKIPHPQLHKRNFTLYPLAEIASELVHPVFRKTVHELQQACKDTLEVHKYTTE